MPVVDRSGRRGVIGARRLLARVLLVLGGVLVVTGIGWLLGTASADAAELPGVPVPPSSAVLSSVTDAIGTPALPAALPTPDTTTTTLASPALPSTPADLGQVTQQVHIAVSGVGARVPPVAAPAASLAPLSVLGTVPAARPLAAAAPVVAAPAVITDSSTVAKPVSVVAHRRSVAAHTGYGIGRAGTRSASGPAHRLPALPPLQPAGSSDAGAHGSGTVAGGAGGPQFPLVTPFGAAPRTVGRPSASRLPVAPGQQPGTSPD